jgi:hypothetical protein
MAKNLSDVLLGISSGVLKVTNGGTGASALSGILKGNNTSAVTTAAVGIDYSAGTSTLSTGILLSTTSTGALSIATAGTHYVAPGGALGTPSSGTLSSCTVDGTVSVGYITVPQNSQAGSYPIVLADSGKHIFHSNATAHTYTIPANSSVAFPIGTVLTFINDTGSGVLSITITTDTMVWIPSGDTTATRTLAAGGMATAIKIASTKWFISGAGVS